MKHIHSRIRKGIRELLIALKKDIEDEYRCTDDPDDDRPGMLVTVATDDMEQWNYQTGDNSFTGGAYGLKHWALVYLHRDSNCKVLAEEAVDELIDLVEEERHYEKIQENQN